eukprot:s200_g47.t1
MRCCPKCRSDSRCRYLPCLSPSTRPPILMLEVASRLTAACHGGVAMKALPLINALLIQETRPSAWTKRVPKKPPAAELRLSKAWDAIHCCAMDPALASGCLLRTQNKHHLFRDDQ